MSSQFTTYALTVQEMREKRRLYDTVSYVIKLASIAIAGCAPFAGWLTANVWYALGMLAVAVALFVAGPKLVDQARRDLKMSWHEIVGLVNWFEIHKERKEIYVWLLTSSGEVVFQYSAKLTAILEEAELHDTEIRFEQRLSPVTLRYIGRNLELSAH